MSKIFNYQISLLKNKIKKAINKFNNLDENFHLTHLKLSWMELSNNETSKVEAKVNINFDVEMT